MPIELKRIDVRRFDASKMQKLNLFETPRFFFDVYCLEPGQSQRPHRHDASDKVYVALQGELVVRIGAEEAPMRPGDAVLAPAGVEHGLENRSSARAAALAFMAPTP